MIIVFKVYHQHNIGETLDKPYMKGSVSARGFDDAVENKILPAHPEILDSDIISVDTDNPYTCSKDTLYTAGGWRDYWKYPKTQLPAVPNTAGLF